MSVNQKKNRRHLALNMRYLAITVFRAFAFFTMIHPSARFDFSRHLDSPVAPGLSDATRWRWISTLLPSEGKQTRHARHAGWIRVHGNTHAPAHREVMLTLRGNAQGLYRRRQPSEARQTAGGSPAGAKANQSLQPARLRKPPSLAWHRCDGLCQ